MELLDSIHVQEVMQTEIDTLKENDSLETATDKFTDLHAHGLPIVNERDELVGIVTIGDIERSVTGLSNEEKEERYENKIVGDICTRDLITVEPEETIGEALRKMGVRDIGRLPVVDSRNPKQLLGILRRSDVVRAYEVALSKRAALRHKARQVRLGEVGRVDVHEIVIQKGAICVGFRVSDIAWPRECVIATIRRGRKLLIPRGETTLQVGDVLAVVAEEGVELQKVRKICST